MALIGEIRKNFWFVLIILGLALAAFVIMDMTSSAQMGNTFNASLGSVNGDKIDAREFSVAESVLSQNSSNSDPNARREELWNYYVEKLIVEDEMEPLGISVPRDELIELQFGQNLSPVIQQAFYDPNLGNVNRSQLNQIQNALLNNQEMGPEFRAYWAEQEKQVIADQMLNKLSNLVGKAAYTPAWMAEEEYKMSNTRAQVAYVRVPFDAIPDDEVEVTDADLKDYINQHKKEYTNAAETRIVDFIAFEITPTAADTLTVLNDIKNRTEQLLTAENDSIYAINNGGAKPPIYYTEEELPAALADSIQTVGIGEVYGPYLDNGVFSAVKLVDKKVIPDSVKASIIFRSAAQTNTIGVENATNLLDSLQNLIETGVAQFDSLAIQNSQDGSSLNGGDLGFMTQGMLAPELDKILFLEGNRAGRLYRAQTATGLFLINITEIIQGSNDPKYRLAYINSPVIPSKATQDSVLDVVNDFLSDFRSLEEMRAAAAENNLLVRSSRALDINAYNINTLGSDQSSRNIVRWAFDPSTEVGDVSPDFFSYQDPVLYYTDKYVVAGLAEIIPAGLQKIDNLRDEVTPIVRNRKKGEKIKAAITGSDLNAVASQYSINVDSISAVTMNAAIIPSIGNEPAVISAIFSVNENEVAGPVIGNSGVYLVKPIAIAPAGEASNVPSMRTSSTNQSRSRVRFGLIEALKKKASIKDERFQYGF